MASQGEAVDPWAKLYTTDEQILEEFEGQPRDYNPYLCEVGPDGPCEGSQPDEHHVLEWKRWKILKRIPEPPPHVYTHVYTVPDSDDEDEDLPDPAVLAREKAKEKAQGKKKEDILGRESRGRNEGAKALGSGSGPAGAASVDVVRVPASSPRSRSTSVVWTPPRTPSVASFADSGLGLSHRSASIAPGSRLNPVAAKALQHSMSYTASEVSSKASTLSSNTRVRLEQSFDRQFVLEQQNFELQATITVLRERILELEAEKRGLEIAQDVLQKNITGVFTQLASSSISAPPLATFASQNPHHNTSGPALQVHEDAGIAHENFNLPVIEKPESLSEINHDCNFWYEFQFLNYEKAARKTEEKTSTLGGQPKEPAPTPTQKMPKEDDDPVPSVHHFLEDEFGQPITNVRATEMSQYSRKILKIFQNWVKKYSKEVWIFTDKSHDTLPIAFQQVYCNSMERHFTELMYCADNWKVLRYFRLRYGEWFTARYGTRKAKNDAKKLEVKQEVVEPEVSSSGSGRPSTPTVEHAGGASPSLKRTNEVLTPKKSRKKKPKQAHTGTTEATNKTDILDPFAVESESVIDAQDTSVVPAAATTASIVVPAAAVLPVRATQPANNAQIPAAASVKSTDPFDRTASKQADRITNTAGITDTQSSNLPKIRIRPIGLSAATRRQAPLPDSGQTVPNDLARQAPAGDHDVEMAPAPSLPDPLPTTDSNNPRPSLAAAPQTAKQPSAVENGSLTDVPDPFPPQAPEVDMEPDEDDDEAPANSKKGKMKGKKAPKVKALKEVKLMIPDVNSVTARNLCALDWCSEHPGGTIPEFTTYWGGLKGTPDETHWKDESKIKTKEKALAAKALRG